MAGITFSFVNFPSLIQLNMGISERLDENRAESFTLLFTDFSQIQSDVIEACLRDILRTSDAIVHYDHYYFFVLPYTDKYGSGIVKNMFEEFFSVDIRSSAISYPIDGENAHELLEAMQAKVQKEHGIYLECLDNLNFS